MATFGGAGVDALSDLIAIAFPVTGTDGTVPAQAGHDQPTVEELLKEAIRQSAGWNSAADIFFAGLINGIPYTIGIVAKIAEQFTGIPFSTWVDQWNADPITGNITSVAADALGTIFTTSVNLQSLFPDMDFTDPDFDVVTEFSDWVENAVAVVLQTLGIWPELVGGVLSSGIIPGLDASKIITGTFGTGLIPGLDVSKITTGLLSGGTILTSLIPGLDASKIITGTLGTGLIPGLDVSKIVSGVFSSGFIPSLPASQITSGTFGSALIPGLDASKIITGSFSKTQITGLVTDLTNLGSDWQSLVDTIVQASNSLAGTGHIVSDALASLQNIPYLNVLGSLGLPNIGDTTQSIIDQFISGFVDAIGTGASLADAFGVANTIGSQSFLGQAAYDFLGIFNNKPFSSGMNPTAVSTIPFDIIAYPATLPTVGVTQGNTIAGLQLFEKADKINYVTWIGSGIASLTAIYADIWKYTAATQSFDWICSVNALSVCGPTTQYNTVQLPLEVDVEPADILMTEIVPVGSGTHTVAAITGAVPNRLDMVPRNKGARKNMNNGTLTQAARNRFLDLQDTFNGGINYTSTWSAIGSGTSASGGQVVVTSSNSGLQTQAHGDASTKVVWVEVPQVITGVAATQLALVSIADSTDFARIYQINGTLFFDEEVNGVVNQTSIAYNATTHRWWRINLEDGSNLQWETSSNGWDWVVRRTKTRSGSIAWSDMKLQLFGGSGGSGSAIFDNVNITPASSLPYSSTYPYIELSREASQSTGIPYRSPEIKSYDNSTSYVVEDWVNYIDVVPLGGAGGASDGAAFSTNNGKGGQHGVFGTPVRWTRGTHFTTGTTVTITVGNGGANSGANGLAGGTTTISVPGYSCTGAGGASQSGLATTGSQVPGEAAGNVIFNGQNYVGGGIQNGQGSAGNAPGGGGGGGASFGGNGGAGAKGRGWLKLFQ